MICGRPGTKTHQGGSTTTVTRRRRRRRCKRKQKEAGGGNDRGRRRILFSLPLFIPRLDMGKRIERGGGRGRIIKCSRQ